MPNNPLFAAPKLSPFAMPKLYLLIVESPKDAPLLADFVNLPIEEREVWIEKLSASVFLGQFRFPPEETLRWIKTKAKIEGTVGVIELPQPIFV